MSVSPFLITSLVILALTTTFAIVWLTYRFLHARKPPQHTSWHHHPAAPMELQTIRLRPVGHQLQPRCGQPAAHTSWPGSHIRRDSKTQFVPARLFVMSKSGNVESDTLTLTMPVYPDLVRSSVGSCSGERFG